MKKILIATMMLGVSSAAALAADMTPVGYDWTGLYAGVNGGYAFSGDDRFGETGLGNVGDLNIHGLFGGAQLGYNQQINNIVIGVETDIQGGDIHDSFTSAAPAGSGKDKIDWFGTLRARAGFAADRALIYATGGLAYGGGKYTDGFAAVSKTYSRAGWTVGGGVEYAVTDSFTVKAEYLYANFGRFTVGGTQATPDFHSVRLGVNFRF